MATLIDRVRTGAWLTRERVRLWALALLVAAAAGIVYLAATSDGLTDASGRPLGTDFSCFYAAGTFVLEGRADLAFDPAAMLARQQAIFGPATPYYGWLYPPFFLLVAGALATLPYALALALWLAATLGLYLVAMWGIAIAGTTLPSALWGGSMREARRGGGLSISSTPHPAPSAPTSPTRGEVKGWLLLALAYPAVFVNIGHGQNGFLTAALFGGALVLLQGRPVAAGVLFGLLVYKPQFGLVIPLALIAGGYGRSIAAAAITAAALALLTYAAFGPEAWRAYAASTGIARAELLEAGVAGWHKMHGVFAVVRMWGGAVPLAYALHAVVALLTAASVLWLWRTPARFALKAAALATATLIIAPHSHDYDLMLLAPAIAFLAMDGFERGFGSWEKTILALLGLAPLATRSVAQHTLLPLGAIAMIALMILVVRRAGLGSALARAKLRLALFGIK